MMKISYKYGAYVKVDEVTLADLEGLTNCVIDGDKGIVMIGVYYDA